MSKVLMDGIEIHIKSTEKMTVLVVQEMVVIIIANTPATKKISGFASHSHCCWFCHLCCLTRGDIESNLDPASWPKLSQGHYNILACAWYDMPSNEAQEDIFNLYGI